MNHKRNNGFTIVELLIVIVIIAILAAITIVVFSGVQDRARNAKIQSDLAIMQKAIRSARENKNQTFAQLMGDASSAYGCNVSNDGTDLNNKSDSNVSNCWYYWDKFRDVMSNASGIDIHGIVDPWGRPYYIQPYEGIYGASYCPKDEIGTYLYPHVKNQHANVQQVAYSGFSYPNCK